SGDVLEEPTRTAATTPLPDRNPRIPSSEPGFWDARRIAVERDELDVLGGDESPGVVSDAEMRRRGYHFSQLGWTRTVSRRSDDDDDDGGSALHDGDPFR